MIIKIMRGFNLFYVGNKITFPVIKLNYRTQLEGKKISDDLASNILKGTLSALEYLHNKNIVHRDLKPENILLTGRKRIEGIKIWDFGLAKVLENGIEGLTSELCGTLVYKAPEQLLEWSYAKVIKKLLIKYRELIFGHAG